MQGTSEPKKPDNGIRPHRCNPHLDAIIDGLGSLFVAAIAYGVMGLPMLKHVAFVFPELMLLVLAVILLLGSYTGYRLSELRRFRVLGKGSS